MQRVLLTTEPAPPAPNQCLANCYNCREFDLCSLLSDALKTLSWQNLTWLTLLISFFNCPQYVSYVHWFYCAPSFPTSLSPLTTLNFICLCYTMLSRLRTAFSTSSHPRVALWFPSKWKWKLHEQLPDFLSEGVFDLLLSHILTVQSIYLYMSHPQLGAAWVKAGNSFKKEEYGLTNQNRNRYI